MQLQEQAAKSGGVHDRSHGRAQEMLHEGNREGSGMTVHRSCRTRPVSLDGFAKEANRVQFTVDQNSRAFCRPIHSLQSSQAALFMVQSIARSYSGRPK
jgi:hypothetical protein